MAITVYTYNDKVLKNSATDKWLIKKEAPDYNPLGLDPGVFRIKVTPGTSSWAGAQTATLVPGTTDTYDVLFTTSNLNSWNKSMALEVLGANTTGWTGLGGMFSSCTNLTSVALFDTSSFTSMKLMFDNCVALTSIPLFDTSKVTDMSLMLSNCNSLTSIPLFDTSKVTDMSSILRTCTAISVIPDFDVSSVTKVPNAFHGCLNVESGALNMYNKFVALGDQITDKGSTSQYGNSFPFSMCGSNTVTGAAELAQIPSSWGGTGA